MKSNYKKLGDIIKEVNLRNTDLSIKKLIGVSIEKRFISSVANIIDTDMSVYKIIKRNQLACKLMSVGRDEKLPVDLYIDDEPAIISSAYYVFEPKNNEILLPEYLKMWLFRSETDRYVGYVSGGDVRGGISWDTFCEMPIIIPSIEKQREIVKEYNVIQCRIAINTQLIAKLEETAQTIYKQWFVDFEFHDENGKPYKSNGGEMVWCEELEKDVPVGWRSGTLEDIYKFQYGLGNRNPNNNGQYPIYGAGRVIGGYDVFNSEDAPVIGHMGEYCGKVVFAFGKHYVTYNGVMCKAKYENHKWFSYLTLLSKDLSSNTRGSSQPFVSYDMLYEFEIILPNKELVNKFDLLICNIFKQINLNILENKKLFEINDLVLARMTKVESEIETVH